MRQTLKTIIRNVKSIKGNSLAEFATTTALMATLAATAAPKLSEMSEGTKAEKSRNEIDKIIKQAGQFYQDKAESEGRGRFPGQSKYNVQVGGTSYTNTDATTSGTASAHTNSEGHNNNVLMDLGLKANPNSDPAGSTDGWQQYDDQPVNAWISVFGTSRSTDHKGITDCTTCTDEWLPLFGNETIASKFQDGHYVYTVVAGGGSGKDVFPPVLYAADVENAVDFNNVIEP